ncbi:MAG: hypothetical protein V3V00_05220 [Saprospiraceae bacterium]
MEILPLILQLVGGALGGVGAGKAMPNASLGSIGNIISGVIGGGGVGQLLLPMLGLATGGGGTDGGMDIAGMLGSLVGGGAGGGIITLVIGMIKNAMSK